MWLALLSNMTWILGTWVLLILTFLGWGFSALRLLGYRDSLPRLLWWCFWVGFGAVLGFLECWNFLFPVNEWAQALVFLMGIVGLVWNYKALLDCWMDYATRPFFGARLSICLLSGLWLANQACAANAWFDSALYHLNGIRWFSVYPVVPGLANLSPPLGYNNLTFLYHAMLNHGPWRGLHHHFASGVLGWAFLMLVTESAFRFPHRKDESRWSLLFNVLMLMPILVFTKAHILSTTATDFPASLLILAAAPAFFAVQQGAAKERSAILVASIFMLATSVTVKVTSLLFTATAVPILLFLWWRSRTGERVWNEWGQVTFVLILVTVPWLIRNVILSGYLLLPGPAPSFGVDWQVPAERLAELKRYSVKWILGVGADASWAEYTTQWWKKMMLPFSGRWWGLGPICATVIGLLISATAGRWRTLPSYLRWAGLVIGPIVAALTLWFVYWPDPRYAAQFFWLLASFSLLIAAALWSPRGPAWTSRLVLGLALAYGTLPFATRLRTQDLFVLPGPANGFHESRDTDRLVERTCGGQLTLQVPERGYLCWDQPLLYTYYPNARLRLRYPPDLSKGFREDQDRQGIPAAQ